VGKDGTTEERLRRLEDRIELQNLIIRYFIDCDDQDYEDLARLFADDAEYAGGTGPQEITEVLRASRSQMGPTIHTPDYMLIEFTEADRASAVIGAHCELARGGTTVFGAARYVGQYVRGPNGWRIWRKERLWFHVGPWDQVGTSLTADLRVRWPDEPPEAAELPRGLPAGG
jgi:hypothetical protein